MARPKSCRNSQKTAATRSELSSCALPVKSTDNQGSWTCRLTALGWPSPQSKSPTGVQSSRCHWLSVRLHWPPNQTAFFGHIVERVPRFTLFLMAAFNEAHSAVVRGIGSCSPCLQLKRASSALAMPAKRKLSCPGVGGSVVTLAGSPHRSGFSASAPPPPIGARCPAGTARVGSTPAPGPAAGNTGLGSGGSGAFVGGDSYPGPISSTAKFEKSTLSAHLFGCSSWQPPRLSLPGPSIHCIPSGAYQ
mmetsp:Transcript_66893/g.217577  ORF Transcript_66893/g.217577 Transcript_66893/m.217577 type:complete len:248 (+) Transcript_66893:386-1129(+)